MIDCLELSQISILGTIRRCMNPGILSARFVQCVLCTDMAITFLGSPYPQVPLDIIIALAQTQYRGDRQPRTFPNFHCRPYTAMYEPGYFARPFCPVRLSTEMAITFLGCPYPQLPFDIIIALVQTRYRDDPQPGTFPNFYCRPYTAVYEHKYFSRHYSPVRLLHR